MNENESGVAVETLLFEALDALRRGEVNLWSKMFHDNGVMEFPYAPPGNPTRLGSRQEIADYMQGYPAHISLKKIERGGTYHSPGVMIVEFCCEGVAVPTGKSFVMKYVGVIEHKDGEITQYRDYWNPLVALQAMGHADALVGTPSETAQ